MIADMSWQPSALSIEMNTPAQTEKTEKSFKVYSEIFYSDLAVPRKKPGTFVPSCRFENDRCLNGLKATGGLHYEHQDDLLQRHGAFDCCGLSPRRWGCGHVSARRSGQDAALLHRLQHEDDGR
ncbi:hypothetical protein MESS4_780021 [Mesorhizobium sp. STM 4661]|nr:hypothetical protein MESS4_780021 [Mesorhizobium sp. STM 4661]